MQHLVRSATCLLVRGLVNVGMLIALVGVSLLEREHPYRVFVSSLPNVSSSWRRRVIRPLTATERPPARGRTLAPVTIAVVAATLVLGLVKLTL